MGMPVPCTAHRQCRTAKGRATSLQQQAPSPTVEIAQTAQAAPAAPAAQAAGQRSLQGRAGSRRAQQRSPQAGSSSARQRSLSHWWSRPCALQVPLLLLLLLLPLLPSSHSSAPQTHRRTRRIAAITHSPTLSHDSTLPHSAAPLSASSLSSPQSNTSTAQPEAQPAGGAAAATVPRGAGVPRYSPRSALKYFQGPLLVRPAPVHLVWYGNWRSGAAGRKDRGQTVLRQFVGSLSAKGPTGPGTVQNWWMINNLFAQKNRQRVTQKVYLASEHYDWYSRGRALSDDNNPYDDPFRILMRLMGKGQLSVNPRAMYVVLTSPDVQVGSATNGFCSVYCGYHDVAEYYAPRAKKGTNIFYSFVGDPGSQCAGCGLLPPTPNALPGIDFMVTTLAHEMAEMATDPDTQTGWLTDQSATGEENADLCIGVYLRLRAAERSKVQYQYNLEGVGGYKFMVQSIYDPVKAACSMVP